MSLLNILGISGSAVSAQSQRLNVVASNLANADSVAGPDGQAYKARQVVFQAEQSAGAARGVSGVRVSNVVEDPAPARRIHDPAHPLADADGYVAQSNVNVIEEMVNMISASRSYQNNIEVMNTTQQLLVKTLQLGQ
ncbi:MAG: flagellar basal body rod protein FlgC [Burkholderiaceae bacterium]|nr:flagellar basal body rod protein FlgC [Burkholderiaceae bacterium]MEB2350379.1 flagellar basal body rod protein FlgC [Burkholderiaceae bacterium]